MLKACEKHAAEPVKGYSACPGCEVEYLRKQNAELMQALQKVRALIPQRMGAEHVREKLQAITRLLPKQAA